MILVLGIFGTTMGLKRGQSYFIPTDVRIHGNSLLIASTSHWKTGMLPFESECIKRIQPFAKKVSSWKPSRALVAEKAGGL